MRYLSPTTRNLFALLLLHAVGITLALHVACSVPRLDTLAHHVDAFAARSQSADSWKPMAAARAWASEHPGASIYEELFFRRRTKFQYPPTSLLFIAGLGRPALNAVSWAAVWLTVFLTVLLFEKAFREAQLPRAGREDTAVRALILTGLCLTFYPLMKAYSLGQIQIWIDLAFTALAWAWWRRAPALGGVLLGAICLVKPPFVLLAGWGAARRQWRFVGAFAATALAGLGYSLGRFGLASHLDYLRVLAYIGRRGETFYANQSFNGLLNRLFGNGDSLVWQGDAFPPADGAVYAGTMILGAALVGAALVLPRRSARGGLLDLSIAALTAVIVSPVAWEHHFGILLPLLAVTTPQILTSRPAGQWTPIVLVVAFMLTGQYFKPTDRLAATWLNPLQSYVLIGALMLLVLWHRAARSGTTATLGESDAGFPAGVLRADQAAQHVNEHGG